MSPISPSATDAQQQAWRYDVQDGIIEILAGLLLVLVSVTVIRPQLTWALALAIFPLRFAAKTMKERFTYPRVGYVKLPSEHGPEFMRGTLTYLVGVIAAVALVLLVLGEIADAAAWMRWMPAITGGFTSGAFLYLVRRTGLPRYRAFATISVVWGIVCATWLGAPDMDGVSRWALWFGVLLFVAGGATFIRFVRTHRVRENGDLHGSA